MGHEPGHASEAARAEIVRTLRGPLDGDLVALFAEEETLLRLRESARHLVHPDAEIVFRGRNGVVLGPFRGVDGFIEGWREWLTPFAEYRVSLEQIIPAGDRVVSLVSQTGRTRHGGVPVPSPPAAAVWTLRDGQLARVVFYLDRAEAAEAEGFDLP